MSYLAPTGLPYLSVSQVETALGAEGCLHKWATRYLGRVRPERDGSALVGERVHGMNEIFMATGVEPLLQDRLTIFHKRRQEHITYAPGEIWASGKHLLPPRHVVKCEGRFRFTTALHGDPVWWQGAKDMEWQDETGLWHVGDLKTTVSFAYQKTADKLRKDWQANLYAYECMVRNQVQVVALDWFTYITDPDKARECRPTSILVLWPEVIKVVSELEERGRALLSHYRAFAESNTLPQLRKNRGVACVAFGGCPYRNTPECPEPTLDELFEAPMSNGNVYEDFLGTIKERLPPPPPFIPVAPPPPVVTVEAGFINPPEAQDKPAPITPEELDAPVPVSAAQVPPVPDDLDALERDALKELGVKLGAIDADCRWQAARLRDTIRAKLKSDALAPPVVVTHAPDGLEMQHVSESWIRSIVRDEVRVLLAQSLAHL